MFPFRKTWWGKKATRPNVPDRGTDARSERGPDMTTIATEILAAGPVLVHRPVRDPAPAPAPPVVGMGPFRAPRTTDTAVVATIVVSATKLTENPPPANVIITTPTPTPPAPALQKAVRTIEAVVPVWENARRPKRNTTLGWRGRRTNGSQPKSE